MLSSATTSSLRVPFGQKNGQMVTPADVPSGRACECFCPGCSLPLLAKKGEHNVWHFAHDGGGCATGAETAIHLMAKQILAAERTISLPAPGVTLSATDAFGKVKTVTANLAKAQVARYTQVDLEVTRDNRRADAVGVDEHGAEHWVEVYVRHAVSAEKAQDLASQEYLSYEIQLNDLSAHLSLAELRTAVIASPGRVRWISYPGMAALRATLTEKLQKIIQASKRKKLEDDAQIRQAYQSQGRDSLPQDFGWGRRQREKTRAEARVAQANQAFRSADAASKRAYLKAKLRIPEGARPALVNVEVRGHDSFSVPRDIWQADVFRKWVFADGRREVSLEAVFSWLGQRYEIETLFPNSAKVALWQYFLALEHAGFVRHRGRQYFEVLRDVAPWLEAAVEVGASWFWSPGAYSCSLEELHKANDAAGCKLSTSILLEVFRRVRAEHSSNGEPDDAARTVALRCEVSPATVLAVMAAAGVASCPKLMAG